MPEVSRRTFVKGAALAGASMTAVGLSGCEAGERTGDQASGEPQVITDDSQIVSVTESYEGVDATLTPRFTWELPVGTVPFHCDGPWAALLMAPASARSVNTLGIVSLVSGALTTLMETPVKGRSYSFHDVRCSEGVYAWVEMNYRTGAWVLFAQPLANGALSGEAMQLDAGDANWEPARFTTMGSQVIWQKMPLATGSKSTESSRCLMWGIGDAESTELYKSPGRFATWPRNCEGILTITPRVRADEGTFYGLTALDLKDGGKTIDQMVMPEGVRPFEAVYMGSTFAFSVEADYGYGGRLGNMGYYIGREGGPFVSIAREPQAGIAGNGGMYLVKVRSSYYLVDTQAQTLGYLSAPDKTLEYGDFPASEGTTDLFVTYATVRGPDGLAASVQMRVFPLG